MRKKDLLSQNIALFDELQQVRIKINKLTDELQSARAENSALSLENKLLKEKLERIEAELDAAASSKAAVDLSNKFADEGNIPSNLDVDEKFELGSKAIGRIVVESAKAFNELNGQDEETLKTLSNMIVYKSELAKSEILSICESDVSMDTKNDMLDSVVNDAVDYFKSVIGQI